MTPKDIISHPKVRALREEHHRLRQLMLESMNTAIQEDKGGELTTAAIASITDVGIDLLAATVTILSLHDPKLGDYHAEYIKQTLSQVAGNDKMKFKQWLREKDDQFFAERGVDPELVRKHMGL